ncbi:MAG: hypothetical protein WCH34_16670 [Bacteroidota bacterium]
MKKIFTVLAAVLLTASVFAQTPQKMSYQAVIRNSSNQLIQNHSVGMKISILRDSAMGPAVYSEIQVPTTNFNGLVSIEIGGGTVVSGNFSAINWALGSYFIKTETDPTGGLNYSITGTSQLLSVPYALYAKSADTLTGGINETDPVYTISQAKNITATDITHLSNLSGINTGDQDLSLYATKTSLADSIAYINNKKVDKVTGKDLAPNGSVNGQMLYWNGTAWVSIAPGSAGQVLTMVNGIPSWSVVQTMGIYDVLNPVTGKYWMDRNLGASQVATSATDSAAYGYLFQWGRGTDGHQFRTSGTTSTLSSSSTPGHSNFIVIINSPPFDWCSPQNNNLWQGVSGINNPCPSGYRLPTETEWNEERLTWGSSSTAGGFASLLKLPMAGARYSGDGSLMSVGTESDYWSSTVSGTYSRLLSLITGSFMWNSTYRALGCSVRCIKN